MPCCVPCVDEGTLECGTGAPLERVEGTFVTSAHEDVLDGPPERAVEHIEEPMVTLHEGILLLLVCLAVYLNLETVLFLV